MFNSFSPNSIPSYSNNSSPLLFLSHDHINNAFLQHPIKNEMPVTQFLPSFNTPITETVLINHQLHYCYGGASSKKKQAKTSSKDRHSKICTAKGPRVRRVRLSIGVARKFFDLQDMLGFDKASKTLDWLLSKSKMAIKDLTKSQRTTQTSDGDHGVTEEGEEEKEDEEVWENTDGDLQGMSSDLMRSEGKEKKMRQKCKNARQNSTSNTRESRAKARARARERTREKLCVQMNIRSMPSSHFDPCTEEVGLQSPESSLSSKMLSIRAGNEKKNLEQFPVFDHQQTLATSRKNIAVSHCNNSPNLNQFYWQFSHAFAQSSHAMNNTSPSTEFQTGWEDSGNQPPH